MLCGMTEPTKAAKADKPTGESSQESPPDAAYGEGEPVGRDGADYENTETGLAPGEYPKEGTFGYPTEADTKTATRRSKRSS